MKPYVIIAAGGTGSRMQQSLPKQFLLLQNEPILLHTIKRFQQALPDAVIIIASPQEYIEYTRELLATNGWANIAVVAGGVSRFHSVQNAFATITDANAIVLVHDAARCLVPATVIENGYQLAVAKGNAVPVVACIDSVRWQDESGNKPLDRTSLKLIQTPQCFQYEQLAKAFALEYQPHFTDEATAVEQTGYVINLYEGDYKNIKVTNPIDLQIAEVYLAHS